MPPTPKKKCCVSKPRCQRCPLRLLAEGNLPEGYTVKRRKLVKVKGEQDKGGRRKKGGKGKKQKVAAAA